MFDHSLSLQSTNIGIIPDNSDSPEKINPAACKSVKNAYLCILNTVSVVQLVEHRIVVPSVVGSSPITHPSASG